MKKKTFKIELHMEPEGTGVWAVRMLPDEIKLIVGALLFQLVRQGNALEDVLTDAKRSVETCLPVHPSEGK